MRGNVSTIIIRMAVYDWLSEDAGDSQNSDSPTSDDGSQPATLVPRSRFRPAGSALAFVRFTNWEPGWSYEGEPTIRWNMEWKVFVKNRE